MSPPDVRAQILEALSDVAPEVDAAALKDGVPLRDQVELDSMDWLRFFGALEKRLAVKVLERDARRLNTLADLVRYAQGQLQPK